MQKVSGDGFFRIIFFSVFFVFSLLLIFLFYLVGGFVSDKYLERGIEIGAENELTRKVEYFDAFLKNGLNALYAARRCDSFMLYVAEPGVGKIRKDTEGCFVAIASSNAIVTQLRYIDEHGFERVRINRHEGAERAYVVSIEELQDKSGRYYFDEVKTASITFKNDSYVWHSAIDLNVEHGDFQSPLKPTLRIATVVRYQGVFRGILIVNVAADVLLNNLVESSFYDVKLLSDEGNLLVESRTENSGVRYLYGKDVGQNKKYWKNDSSAVMQVLTDSESGVELFLKRVEYGFDNKEVLYLLLSKKPSLKDSVRGDAIEVAAFIVPMSVLLSLCLSFLFGGFVSRLYKLLLDSREESNKHIELIDQYIPISQTDLEGTIVGCNAAYLQMTGYSTRELVGKNHSVLGCEETSKDVYESLWGDLTKGKKWSGELQDKRKDGSVFWVSLNISPVYDAESNIKGYAAISQDVSYRKQLERQAVIEPMTELYNRRCFEEMLSREWHRCKREGRCLGLAVIDTDYFKQYNDTFGHDAGDYLLVQLSNCIKSAVNRGSDFAFRIGGDEFAIIFSGLNKVQATQFLDGIRCSFAEFEFDHPGNGQLGFATISIGCALVKPIGDSGTEELFKSADQMLYQSKAQGRNCTCVDDRELLI